MNRIKLGILQVNHDKSIEVGDSFADDAHRFRDLFDDQDERFRYRVYMTIGGELPGDLDEQDAYLITGSPLSVLDKHIFSDALADFIRRCDDAKKPLIGACFGHQAIALALGGQVERSESGYNVGIEETTFHVRRPWMKPQHNSLSMYVFHEDQVTALPEGCELLGSSDNCKIAQAHPEFTEPFMTCVLDYVESRQEPEQQDTDTFTTARASLQNSEQGEVFARWCTNFLKRG